MQWGWSHWNRVEEEQKCDKSMKTKQGCESCFFPWTFWGKWPAICVWLNPVLDESKLCQALPACQYMYMHQILKLHSPFGNPHRTILSGYKHNGLFQSMCDSSITLISRILLNSSWNNFLLFLGNKYGWPCINTVRGSECSMMSWHPGRGTNTSNNSVYNSETQIQLSLLSLSPEPEEPPHFFLRK